MIHLFWTLNLEMKKKVSMLFKHLAHIWLNKKIYSF